MPSADFCSITPWITPRSAIGSPSIRSYPSMGPDRPRLAEPGASLVLYRSHVEQISPGKSMILPYTPRALVTSFGRTTAAFTLPQWSGWASSCCADSPWGSALICSFCSSARRFALGLLSDARLPLRPCRRLVLFEWSLVMTTLQTMYRGLAPHKIMPMPGTHKLLHLTQRSMLLFCAFAALIIAQKSTTTAVQMSKALDLQIWIV
jgi:hypothetical protein